MLFTVNIILRFIIFPETDFLFRGMDSDMTSESTVWRKYILNFFQDMNNWNCSKEGKE